MAYLFLRNRPCPKVALKVVAVRCLEACPGNSPARATFDPLAPLVALSDLVSVVHTAAP